MEHRRRATFAALALLPLVAALPACQSIPTGQSGGGLAGTRLTGDDRAWAAAAPTDELVAYEASRWGTLPEERAEYARRDRAFNVTQAGPILATGEWPTPVPPRERRFRFFYWRTD